MRGCLPSEPLSEADARQHAQQLIRRNVEPVDVKDPRVRCLAQSQRHLVERLGRRRFAESYDANPASAKAVSRHG